MAIRRKVISLQAGIMAIPATDKHTDYAHYAAHCLYLMSAATDPDSRAIQREMAAEWLKLADAIRHPLEFEEVN
jgi:hypothetical protein